MNNCLIWFAALFALFCLPAMAAEGPLVKPPTADELRAVQLPDSAMVTVSAYGNSAKFAFAIFECKSQDRVCYLFRSLKIDDFVDSTSKLVNGELELMSRQEVLKFFIVRFRGIANDVSHQKWRPDVIDKYLGPLEPLSGDTAKLVGMHSLFYDGYAAAMEEVLVPLVN